MATPVERIRQLMDQEGFRFTKSLGQNFLTDENIVRKIVAEAALTDQDAVIEIGAGAGTVTAHLLQQAGCLLAVEIDRRLIGFLAQTLGSDPRLTLWHEDVLQADLAGWIAKRQKEGYRSFKVVGNLPYYVTTPIIMKLLEEELPVEKMVLMVQKEVARRLAALPGQRDYGSLTVAVGRYCRAKVLFDVSCRVFTPQPAVDSSVVCLQRRPVPEPPVNDAKMFFRLVRAAFGQRRKTLLNALAAMPEAPDKEEVRHRLHAAGIDPKRRGETLSIEEFARLTNEWHARKTESDGGWKET